MTPNRSYQFGSFRLDSGGRVLFREGHRVALTPKAIDLLIVLEEAQREPVGKEELLAKVWAGTVVEEGSLAQLLVAGGLFARLYRPSSGSALAS